MVFRKKFKVQSNDKVCTFHNVTDLAKQTLRESGIQNGIVVVYSHHTTCSVITQECAFDLSMTGLETLQQDLINVMEDWIPTQRSEGMYLHPGQKALVFAEEHGEDNRGCHNTDAHVRSSIIGRSQTLGGYGAGAGQSAGLPGEAGVRSGGKELYRCRCRPDYYPARGVFALFGIH